MDDYDWAVLDWLESRCMDGAYIDEKECYPKEEDDAVPYFDADDADNR